MMKVLDTVDPAETMIQYGQAHDLVQNDIRLTICEMAVEVYIFYGSCQVI
jgi:hypothetical protein